MSTENGHSQAHRKASPADGSLAGYDTLEALLQVICNTYPDLVWHGHFFGDQAWCLPCCCVLVELLHVLFPF